MPDHEDDLDGKTLDGGEAEADLAGLSLGDGHTMGDVIAGNSLGDQSTLGDAVVDDELFDDGMELVDLSARYTEEHVLGKGGFGEVILATDTRLERKVAIKRILGKAARSKTAVRRFLTEAKSIAALNHNNIVQIYDYGRATDGPYLIMECVQGGSLLDQCKKGPIELDEAVTIFSQLCDGLAKAHAAGIIHRDIKPANVLMTEDGVPKLTDFGLAKDDTADTGMTMEGAVIGTLDFMPPEQRQAAELTDHRSDLWSLAATFYQMLTGKSPKVINIASLPAKLQSVVTKALEESKEDRFQSVHEMRDEILQAHSGKMDTSRALREGECPQCATPNPPKGKFCIECSAILQVQCMNCEVEIQTWNKACGECGAQQTPLVDKALADLKEIHDQAESLLADFEFQAAADKAASLPQETDSRLQQYEQWRSEFTARLEQTRLTELARLAEQLNDAVTHENAGDYEAALQTIEQIANSLKQTYLLDNLHYGTAQEIQERLKLKQTQLKELEQIVRQRVTNREIAGLLPIVNELLTLRPDRPEVLKLKARLEKRDADQLEAQNRAAQQLNAQQYADSVSTLNSISEEIWNEQLEDLKTKANNSLNQLNNLRDKITTAVNNNQLTGLLPVVQECLTLKADQDDLKELKKQLEKHEADLIESRDATIKQATQQLLQQQYRAALATLNTVSEEVSTKQLEDLKIKASDFLYQLNDLREKITTGVDGNQLAGLLPVVNECLALKSNQVELVELQEQLENREAGLIKIRDAAVEQANQQLGQQEYPEAIATLNTVPAEVYNEQVEHLKANVNDLLNQLNNLRDRISTAVDSNQLNGLLPAVEECLTLKSDQVDLVTLKQKLIYRDTQMHAHHQQIILQAKTHIKQAQFDEAVQVLDTIPQEYQTTTTIGLSQQAHHFSALRNGLLNSQSSTFIANKYKPTIENISNYLNEIANVGIQDPQLQQLLDAAKGKASASSYKKKLVALVIVAACIAGILITGLVNKINRDIQAVEAAIANLDWETALELDPHNSDGLRLKAAAEEQNAAKVTAAAKTAAVTAALNKGDWKAVLAIDPENDEGMRMKTAAAARTAGENAAAQRAAITAAAAAEDNRKQLQMTATRERIAAEREAVAAALAKGDWLAVLVLEPDNAAGLRMKAAAEKAAVEKATAVSAALSKGDWATVLALEPENAEGLRLKVAATKSVGGSGFAGRGAQTRAVLVRDFGGTKQSEAAVAMALKWIANHQNSDGSWRFDHSLNEQRCNCSKPGSLKSSMNGATAMALLPFLGSGNTHKKGAYKKQVEAGLVYLTRAMKVNDTTGDLTDPGGRMYSHGLAAIAFCEAFAMTKDPQLMAPAQRSLNFISYAQDPVGGGWRYRPRQAGDTCVSGWQLMALKSGYMGGLQIPAATIQGCYKFLDSVADNNGATFGYQSPGAGQATTAVGLLCRMYMGWKKEEPALQRGVEQLAKWGPSKGDIYYNYYATQVMRHHGGKSWDVWNEKIRDSLIASQEKGQSHSSGSWAFASDEGAQSGGRLYTTTLATMILEVYYRHIPLYTPLATDE
ncbi:MAG: protein kinase [Planctomycetaceae bacterium]|nr:protein kinase [Planctomycetaceae bacterium]